MTHQNYNVGNFSMCLEGNNNNAIDTLERQFWTSRSHKRELTDRGFCLFVDNMGTIFEHVSKFNFSTATSDKGYI
jgi:hypothetical protein